MSELLINNIKLTRGYFLKNVKALDESLVDVQPEGFNNTLKWHIGHVLTVTEQLMFGFPKNNNNLSVDYKELFARGTKPSDWQGQVPTVKELVVQLTDQLTRMMDIPVERLSEKLESPFLGCETFGDLINFCLFHENLHLGQIQAMKRVIETAQA